MTMNGPLKNIFELQVKSLKGFNFQDFVSELFLLKFGERDFIPPRKVKDKGCDGIIASERRVVSCYAPEANNSREFLKKVNDDFGSYKINWEKDYPNWMFITNLEVSPDQVKKINELKPDAQFMGIKNILALIEDLHSFKRKKLGRYLRIEDIYFTRDYLQEILEDLLKEADIDDMRVPYSKPPYIPDKIELNFSKEDVEGALQEYEIACEYFPQISSLLSGYDTEIGRIKFKIITDYNKTMGYFKERLELQTQRYLEKYASEDDDDYLFYIRAILLYIFEQCLIGQKTGVEKSEGKK
ncbi:MAG TPA: hypothetical protein VK469_11340 [Candidatus Kapabacteria bacterium]|nr:hypothetical protein [Candidatus Kapabacteria bacterium]